MRMSKAHRRITGLAAAAISISLTLTACGGNTGDDGGKPEIGVAEINLSLPFFVQMQKASKEMADDYGVDVTWQSVDGSVEKQISTIENFTAQGKDVILVDPTNADALTDVINKATDAGVKVISMGNKIDGNENYNTLYPDYDNWVNQARVLGKELGGKGKVLFLIGNVGNYVSDTRQEAFEKTMAEEFPKIDVITQPTEFDSSKAGSVTQTVVTNNPDLAGVASISDGLTLPAIKVIEQEGLDIPFVSNDGDKSVFPYIESGRVITDVMTGSHRVGAWNTAVAARIAKGSDYDTDLFMPTYTVSSEDSANRIDKTGLDLETVTTEEAQELSTDYLKEFGSDRPDSDMSVK